MKTPPYRLAPTCHALRTYLTALLLLTACVVSAQNKDQLVVPLSSPGKPGLLRVKTVNGSITVVGYSGKDVLIDASTKARGRDDDDDDKPRESSGGLRRIAGKAGFDVTAEENDNRVTVSSNSWQQPTNLTIRVPQRFSLQISTVNDGDILVENVTGELEVSNVNGDVTLRQVSGSAVANTVNGAIKATFKSVTGGTPMAFSTVNGDVDVTLPASAKAALKLKSDQGEIYSDFDLVTDKTPAKVNRTTQNGVYRLNADGWTYGKLSGGGAEIMMKSLMGDIFIRRAK
ncbi:DUF4097 family beta strand repeat-containing protein [Hymenobacter sp. BT635]|uniref:DUF4097 family beta strand repeat-containing protein n=1 Tax=Hymenobacter nitidus TaxID=2880929 RepID=A0ABS8AC59_9BACT|nr:DUF4097 family beta strand repeat-containing protein [Hymenobacter nitidus]MCB2376820.1 DUF4097 family beta strand repeat-containing protein [Hymenobacter nitidus]